MHSEFGEQYKVTRKFTEYSYPLGLGCRYLLMRCQSAASAGTVIQIAQINSQIQFYRILNSICHVMAECAS